MSFDSCVYATRIAKNRQRISPSHCAQHHSYFLPYYGEEGGVAGKYKVLSLSSELAAISCSGFASSSSGIELSGTELRGDEDGSQASKTGTIGTGTATLPYKCPHVSHLKRKTHDGGSSV